MKKILSLFALVLLSCMGAWAQTTVEGAKGTIYVSPALDGENFANGTRFYTIEIGRNNCMLDSRYLPTVQQKKSAACDQNKWAVVAATGGYQFINKATKKALTFASTANDAISSLTDNLDDTNSVFEFVTTQNSIFASGYELFKIASSESGYPNDKNNGLAIWADTQALWGWGNSASKPGNGDDGSKFKFTEVEVLNNVVLESLSLNVSDITMNIGQLQSLTVTATPAEASNEVEFSTSNAAVARVVDGKIQAISEGSATITVTSVKDPTISVTCEVTVQKPDWYVHVSPEMGKSGTDRAVNTITLNGTNITVPAYSYPYVDLTTEKFTVEAGQSLQAAITNIGWMHSMVYVDTDDDRQFTEGEMVTHSTLTGGSGTNAGIAAFNAPANAGTYRMRFKTDWHGNNANGNDPAGRIGDDGTLTGTNSIWSNRGVIIDVMLEVVAPVAKTNVTYKVANCADEEVDVVVENVVVGSTAAVPAISGYFTGATITESDLVVSETNNTFHVTGTWELPFAEDKYYTMHSANTDEYEDYVCNGTVAWCNGSVAVDDNNNVWQLAHVAGTLDLFTLKNYGHNKYAVLPSNGRQGCTFADAPTVWTSGTGATSYFRLVKQNGGFNLQHPGDAETNVGSHYDYKLGSWKNANSATNASSINVVQETTPTDPKVKANVTYEVYLNDVKLYQDVKVENVGDNTAFALTSSAADYVNVDFTPEEITGDMTVRVNTSYKATLPFKTDGTLYNLALNRRTPALEIYYVDGETQIFTKASDNTSYVAPTYATQNFYKWVIGGDWYNGFTLKNAGANKYVSYGSNNPSDKSTATLAEDTDGDGCHFELRIKNNAQYYFRIMGTTNGAYISNHGGATTTFLTNWNSENNYTNNDVGAQFLFTEAVELPEPPQYDWAAFLTKLTKLQQYTFGEGLGQYAEVDLTDYTFNSVGQALVYFADDLAAEAEDDYDDDMEAMDKILANLHLNMPKAGDLLVIKGATTGKYVYADADAEANNGGITQLAQGDLGWPNDPESYEKWASAIFYYDGQHLISYNSHSGSGFYVFRSGLSNNPAAVKDVITFHEGSKVGCYRIHTDNANSNWYDYHGTTGRINRWSANDAELTNFVLEYPSYDYVHIGSAGYATVCLPVDVAWEYGESGAYTVNEVDGVLKATRINGCIPAGVPAVITGHPGNYILKPAGRWASADAEQFTTNVLRGTYAAMEKPANALVFNVLDEVPGFYGYTGTYLNGFKAYYENPAGASNLRINFEGTLTAIESAVEAAQGHQIFDLQGRRVNGTAHGLFIQNGKKVVK